MSKEIFNGVSGFSGFYNAFSGDKVQITFVRANANGEGTSNLTESELDQGFLVQTYRATWARNVAMERVLNRQKPVAMISAGSGTLQITGLVGTKAGITSLLQANEQCSPLVAIIRGAANFSNCDTGASQSTSDEVTIKLTNVIPTTIDITGNSQNNGLQLQSATAAFVFGGFGIED